MGKKNETTEETSNCDITTILNKRHALKDMTDEAFEIFLPKFCEALETHTFQQIIEDIRNLLIPNDEQTGGAGADLINPYLQNVSSASRTKKLNPIFSNSINKYNSKSKRRTMKSPKSASSKQENPPLSEYKDLSIVKNISNTYISTINRAIQSVKDIEDNYNKTIGKSQKSK